MSVADRIGLLPGFSWVAEQPLGIMFLVCLLLSPVGYILVGILGESRLVPLTPDKQFRSFFPGNLYLGIGATALLVMARWLPAESRWYSAAWWHVIVFAFTIAIAVGHGFFEWRGGIYPTRAMLSPTKIYLFGVLYMFFIYIIVTSTVAVAFGSPWRSERMLWVCAVVALWFIGRFGILAVKDSSLSRASALSKAQYAHDEFWVPAHQVIIEMIRSR